MDALINRCHHKNIKNSSKKNKHGEFRRNFIAKTDIEKERLG